jgi:hypothetical protein
MTHDCVFEKDDHGKISELVVSMCIDEMSRSNGSHCLSFLSLQAGVLYVDTISANSVMPSKFAICTLERVLK